MFFSHKAYVNASGKPAAYLLTHDIKRCLADAKAPSGLVNILSTQATTAVTILENDEAVRREALAHAQKTFEHVPESKGAPRRSGTGPDRCHLMAALTGLALTLPFAAGRLSIHPQHEVFALDYEPKPGRREFVITVLGEGGGAPAR